MYKLRKNQNLPDGFPVPLWSPKRPERPDKRSYSWATCIATLFPLVERRPSIHLKGSLPSWVPYMAWQLYIQRAIKLTELRDLGCTPLPTLDCCTPNYVRTDLNVLWTCRSTWCPFCWGRRVVGNVLDRAIAVPRDWYRSYTLAELRAYEYLSDSVDNDHVRDVTNAAATRVLKQLQWTAGPKLGRPGLVRLTTLEPTNLGWKVTVRAMALLSANFVKKHPAPSAPERKVVYHNLTGRRDELAQVVGRVCQYPFELLFRPAPEVKQALALREGLRLLVPTGVFRSKQPDP